MGAASGSTSFINDVTQQRVSEWIAGVSVLSSFANTQPLESILHNQLFPNLVPHAVSDIECELFSFSMRFGGLRVCKSASEQQYDFSKALLQGFADLVLSQKSTLCLEVIHHQNDLFRHLREQSLSAH